MKAKLHTSSFTFDGKRYFCRAETEAKAIAKATVRKTDLEKGRVEISRSMTVSQWAKQYLATYRKPILSDKSYRDAEGFLRNWILPIIGGLKISRVKSTHCQAVMNQLDGKSYSLADKVAQLLRDLLDRAQSNDLCHTNPAHGKKIRMPSTKKGTHRSITDSERAALLKVCETHKYGLWALTLLCCGLRPHETALIRGKDIDLAARSLHVPGTKSAAADRYVYIPWPLAEKLASVKVSPFDYLFKNARGKRLTKTNMQRMWAAIKKEMHVTLGGRVDYGRLRRVAPPYAVADDLVPYCLRHTFCTDLQAAGVPINVAKELMGHAKIETTANIYTHSSEAALKSARDQMEKFYSDDGGVCYDKYRTVGVTYGVTFPPERSI